MDTITLVLLLLGLVCVGGAATAILYQRSRPVETDMSLIATGSGRLDWRPMDTTDGTAAVELRWELGPLMSIERLDARGLVASAPVSGALGELVSRMLDDDSVRKLLKGQKFALVKLPAGSRARDLVKTIDGRTVPIVRDASGRFGRLGTVVGGTGAGAGVGTAVATAPAVAAAVAAAWAHQQLAATVTAMRDGMERISLRLDDSDHGVLAAAQAHMASLSGAPSSWSELDRDALAHHRVMLDGVFHTAKRRADRRFAQLEAGDELPRLDAAEVAEIRRDFVLSVDAELVSGQMDLVHAVAQIESNPDTGLRELARVEKELTESLDQLAERIGGALDRDLPGRHRGVPPLCETGVVVRSSCC